MVCDFQDFWYSNLENENTLDIETRKQFTEAAIESCSSKMCLSAIIKII